MDDQPVVSDGAALPSENGGMVPANEVAPVVEGGVTDAAPAVEPVADTPVVPVPDVVPEPAVPEAPAPVVTPDREIMNVTPVVDHAPIVEAPTPTPAPPVEEPPVVQPPSVPSEDEGPAPAPEPVPADENTDAVADDVAIYEDLSGQIEALGHEIADHLLVVELESKRATYLDLLAKWQEAAQKLHAGRYGARMSVMPVPEFKVMSPCSHETLAWLVAFFGLHVSAAE